MFRLATQTRDGDMASENMIMGAAALTTTLPAIGVASLPPSQFYDDWRMVCTCVVGSMIGAFLSIALFAPPDSETANLRTRRLAWKFFASLFSGVAFAPFLIENAASLCSCIAFMRPTIATIMAVSSGLAFLFVWALHHLTPYIERWFDYRLQRNSHRRHRKR